MDLTSNMMCNDYPLYVENGVRVDFITTRRGIATRTVEDIVWATYVLRSAEMHVLSVQKFPKRLLPRRRYKFTLGTWKYRCC